jgi:MraZ protein
MLIVGETARSIDEKQRISIPKEMREFFVMENGPSIVYATPGANGSIWLYPKAAFESRANVMENSLLPNEDEMELEQILFSQTTRLEIDKSGRIRLPEVLLSFVGIDAQAILLGVRDHIEVVNPQNWVVQKREGLPKLKEIMARIRNKKEGKPC